MSAPERRVGLFTSDAVAGGSGRCFFCNRIQLKSSSLKSTQAKGTWGSWPAAIADRSSHVVSVSEWNHAKIKSFNTR